MLDTPPEKQFAPADSQHLTLAVGAFYAESSNTRQSPRRVVFTKRVRGAPALVFNDRNWIESLFDQSGVFAL